MSYKTLLKFDSFYLSILLVLIPLGIFGQSKDYHRDESPAVSWNGIVLNDARSAAIAGISVFSSNAGAAAANPALLKKTDSILFATSYALTGTTAYQYQTMNTGVFYAQDKIYEFNDDFTSLSANVSFRNINIGAGYYKNALLDLPDFDVIDTGYSASTVFSGCEDAYYLAASYDLSDMTFGLKFTWVDGKRTANLHEVYDGIEIIEQNQDYGFDYYIISLGIDWKAAESIYLSAVFDYPITNKQDAEYSRIFLANIPGGAYIEETNTSKDDLYRPSKVIAAALLTPFAGNNKKDGKEIAVGVELTYTFWNSYRYFMFGDEMTRNFDDTAELAVGFELPVACRGFNLAFRGGYRLDPQPVPEPKTTLNWLTFGAGIEFRGISFDVAGSYIFGSLPEWNPQNFTAVATLAFQL
jgi:hypothetical protein